jgi:hypothetical protein
LSLFEGPSPLCIQQPHGNPHEICTIIFIDLQLNSPVAAADEEKYLGTQNATKETQTEGASAGIGSAEPPSPCCPTFFVLRFATSNT